MEWAPMAEKKKNTNPHKALFAKPSKKIDKKDIIDTPKDADKYISNASVTQMYLREIGYTALLTAEEEQTLARKIAKGDKQAWDHMITANLRLVIKIAKFYNRSRNSFMDLVAEGNVGLITAVKKFNPDLGFRFSTYATWWIRQHIEHSLISQGRTIRVPTYIQRELKKYLRASAELSQELDHTPSHKEIAKKMQITVEKLHHILQHTQFLSSIDEDPEDRTAIIDKITSEQEDNPSKLTQNDDTVHTITRWINQLEPIQREVITLRYGLEEHSPHTLEDTAEALNVTREKVRQIQMKALQKLQQITKDEKRSRRDDTSLPSS